MKIKVCGITSVEQMQALQALEVDYAGLIFYPKSARYAGEKLNGAEEAIRNIPIDKVGVFVNADVDEVKRKIKDFDLAAVQLHGDESPEYCKNLMEITTVIKVFRISIDGKLNERIQLYKNVCHYYLFDTDTKMYGGSGKRFDWTILNELDIDKPFFLSGGIGPDDVTEIKMFQNPLVNVVDVNSRFETTPGLKDMQTVTEFVNKLKAQ